MTSRLQNTGPGLESVTQPWRGLISGIEELMSGVGILVQSEDQEHERQHRHRFRAGATRVGSNTAEGHARHADISQAAYGTQHVEPRKLQGNISGFAHATHYLVLWNGACNYVCMRHNNRFHTVLQNVLFIQAAREFKTNLRKRTVCAVVAASFTGCAAMAQSTQPTRFNFSPSVIQSRPQGAFRANAGNALGGAGTFLYHLDHDGWASVRFDAAWMQYGREKKSVPLSETVGERVLVD